MAGPILSKKTSPGGNTLKVPPRRLWPDVHATVSLLKNKKTIKIGSKKSKEMLSGCCFGDN